ncbi:MAG: C40 family peptidase [Bacteroidales bacterium]
MQSKGTKPLSDFYVISLRFSLALVVLMLASCAIKKKGEKSQASLEKPGDKLMSVIDSWVGTPYKYGGETRSGTDCSGFVKAVYSEVYGISLPRTSQAMLESAQGIDPDQLRPGDLVFFEISLKNYHVGIYTGDRKFAHASEKKGVIISSLDEPYYIRTFIKAGRFL